MLAADEAVRSSGIAILCIIIASLTLCCLTFLGGHPVAKTACAVALVSIISVSIWLHRRLQVPRPELTLPIRIFGTIVLHGLVAVDYYMGFFSPVVLVKTLGIYYIGMSQDDRFSRFFAAHLTLVWLTFASLVAFGFIPDEGLYELAKLPTETFVFALIAVPLTLTTAWWAARSARAALRSAVTTTHEALVQVDNREALLAEAQNQLDRAMRLAIGQPGRYTGRRAGEHVLDVVIGFGAMGEVYSARRDREPTSAAVKLLRPEALRDPKLVDRFLREAAISQRLTHPNVVEVRDVGQLEGGAPYLAMELLQGQDLATVLRKRDHLPWEEVEELGSSLAMALDHAHYAGVIHRDLKPHNIFHSLDGDGQRRWKILDFGISKLLTGSATLTQDGVVGTPSYMSPEQAQGLPVDHRSDVFALAAVIYRAATGRPAFPGKDTPGIMFDVVYRTPQRPTAVDHEVPPLVDLVLAVGMAKSPGDRFQSAGAFGEALTDIKRGKLRRPVHRSARRVLKKNPWGQSTTPDRPSASDRSGD